MFVQVIQGRTSDAEALKEQFDRWYEELGSDAEGFLGSTGGVSSDGDVIVLARFESEEAARANSERSEQQSWWEETSELFEGDATFHDCDDVETYLEGGSDDAGFVQVIQGRVSDRDRYATLQQELQETLQEERPEVLGMLQAWDGDLLTNAVYFASEHTAREGEGRAVPEERLEQINEMRSLMEDLTYTDLVDPWLLSPKSDEEDEDS